jgi:hypothetical protein
MDLRPLARVFNHGLEAMGIKRHTMNAAQNENVATPLNTPPTTPMKRPAGAAVSPQLAPKRPCMIRHPLTYTTTT